MSEDATISAIAAKMRFDRDNEILVACVFSGIYPTMSDSEILKHLIQVPKHRPIVQNMSPELSAALEILEL